MLRDRTIFFRRSFPRDKLRERFRVVKPEWFPRWMIQKMWRLHLASRIFILSCNFLFCFLSVVDQVAFGLSFTFNSATWKFILRILAHRAFVDVSQASFFLRMSRSIYIHACAVRVPFAKSFYNSFPFHNDKLTWCTHNAHSQLHSITLNNWAKTNWLIVSLRVRVPGKLFPTLNK